MKATMRGMDKVALGEQIRERRISKNWRQQDLADAAGISKAMVSKIERGDHNATADVLDQVARALNCSISMEISDGDELKRAKELYRLYQSVPQRVQDVVREMLKLNRREVRQRRRRGGGRK